MNYNIRRQQHPKRNPHTEDYIGASLEPKVKAAFEKTNTVGASFLKIDSEIALTFCSLALASQNREIRERRAQTAQRAYDTIRRLMKNIKLNDHQLNRLNADLQRLKIGLRNLGHS